MHTSWLRTWKSCFRTGLLLTLDLDLLSTSEPRIILTVRFDRCHRFYHSLELILAEGCLPKKPCKSSTDIHDFNVPGSFMRLFSFGIAGHSYL